MIHETYKAIHNGSENITSEAHRSNKKNKNERSDKDKHPESEGDYDHIIDLESSEGEAYEDGDSADEHGSHCGSNSQENDRENGNCDEVNEVCDYRNSLLMLVEFTCNNNLLHM